MRVLLRTIEIGEQPTRPAADAGRTRVLLGHREELGLSAQAATWVVGLESLLTERLQVQKPLIE